MMPVRAAAIDPEYQILPDGNHILAIMYTPRSFFIKISPQPGTYGSYAIRVTSSRYSPPEIFTTSLEQAYVGSNYNQKIAAADPDMNDTVTYQLLSGPSWMSIDSNGYLTGTPRFSHQGTSIPVAVKVIDSFAMEEILETTVDVVYVVDPPTNFTVTDVPDDQGYQLELSWNLSSVDSYISHYNIYRSLFYEFTSPLSIDSFSSIEQLITAEQSHSILIATVDPGVSSYTDTSLPLNNQLYYYWISAVDESGESEKTAANYQKSLEFDYPPPKVVAFRQIHGFATVISKTLSGITLKT